MVKEIRSRSLVKYAPFVGLDGLMQRVKFADLQRKVRTLRDEVCALKASVFPRQGILNEKELIHKVSWTLKVNEAARESSLEDKPSLLVETANRERKEWEIIGVELKRAVKEVEAEGHAIHQLLRETARQHHPDKIFGDQKRKKAAEEALQKIAHGDYTPMEVKEEVPTLEIVFHNEIERWPLPLLSKHARQLEKTLAQLIREKAQLQSADRRLPPVEQLVMERDTAKTQLQTYLKELHRSGVNVMFILFEAFPSEIKQMVNDLVRELAPEVFEFREKIDLYPILLNLNLFKIKNKI